jgi:hypothetical protein
MESIVAPAAWSASQTKSLSSGNAAMAIAPVIRVSAMLFDIEWQVFIRKAILMEKRE